MLDQLQSLIANLGFPIVVTLILLMQYKKTLDHLTGGIEKVASAVDSFKRELLDEFRKSVRHEIKSAITDKCPASEKNLKRILQEVACGKDRDNGNHRENMGEARERL